MDHHRTIEAVSSGDARLNIILNNGFFVDGCTQVRFERLRRASDDAVIQRVR